MPRISAKFAELKAQRRGALVTYAMAGYPSAAGALSVLRGFVKGGADIIEIGFPFSDPLADGPAIQEAGMISLQNGTKNCGSPKPGKKAQKRDGHTAGSNDVREHSVQGRICKVYRRYQARGHRRCDNT